MKFKGSLTKRLLSLGHHKNSITERRLINPGREWMVGLFGSLGVFFAGAVYLGYGFYSQYNETDVLPVVNIDNVTYHAGDATAVMENYEKREERFSALRSVRPHRVMTPDDAGQGISPHGSVEDTQSESLAGSVRAQ